MAENEIPKVNFDLLGTSAFEIFSSFADSEEKSIVCLKRKAGSNVIVEIFTLDQEGFVSRKFNFRINNKEKQFSYQPFRTIQEKLVNFKLEIFGDKIPIFRSESVVKQKSKRRFFDFGKRRKYKGIRYSKNWWKIKTEFLLLAAELERILNLENTQEKITPMYIFPEDYSLMEKPVRILEVKNGKIIRGLLHPDGTKTFEE